MSTLRSERVGAAIASIRALHEVGREVLEAQAGRRTDGPRVIAEAAGRHRMNPTTVRMARQFSEPTRGYSRQELADLCREIKGTQTRQDDGLPVFTVRHLVLILTIHPKLDWAALQTRAIGGGWSSLRLRAEIARRYGRRQPGGRPRNVPTDPVALIVQAEQICDTWVRWYAAAARFAPSAKRGSVMASVPKRIQRTIREVTDAVAALHHTVLADLQKRQPGRVVKGTAGVT